MKYRTIFHVDMDAFFAAVEQLDQPSYKNKPVVVGANPRPEKAPARGVVAAASYEARHYGIYSAMPISEAFRRCPQAIFLAPRIHRYREVSQKLFKKLKEYSDKIEPLSIDEAFLDCTHNIGSSDITNLATQMKKSITEITGLGVSIGVASNKSVAKIASGLNKPNGLTVCPAGYEKKFLSKLPVKKLWGVGEKTNQKLFSLNIKTIGDLAGIDPVFLQMKLGKYGVHIWQLSQGIDEREVYLNRQRKSISEEITFHKDITGDITGDGSEENQGGSLLQKYIAQIAFSLSLKLQKKKIYGRTFTLKIRFSNFQTFTKSKTIMEATNSSREIKEIAYGLYKSFDRLPKKIRLLGLGITKLKIGERKERQQYLFYPL